jgi:hypothetical protein
MTFSEVKQTVDPTRIGAEIGILLYPNSQAAAVYGLTDLFCAANAIHCARGGSPCSEISVSHWKLNEDSGRIRRIYTTHPGRTQSSRLSFFRRAWGFPAAVILKGSDFAVG